MLSLCYINIALYMAYLNTEFIRKWVYLWKLQAHVIKKSSTKIALPI